MIKNLGLKKLPSKPDGSAFRPTLKRRRSKILTELSPTPKAKYHGTSGSTAIDVIALWAVIRTSFYFHKNNHNNECKMHKCT